MNTVKNKTIGPLFGPLFFMVHKSSGMTSFDIIRIFKKKLSKRIGKIGHFGTLDPFADGLMIVGIGGATRLNDFSQNYSKEYIATGKLGLKSETGDITAAEDQFEVDPNFKKQKEDVIREVLSSFQGSYMQAPHKYSAAKFEGKNLYEWAREGVSISKPEVERHIHEIELLETDGEVIKFRVKCSSGTFIRVLFEDIAKKLGTLGHLIALTRSEIGHINVKDSFDLDVFNAESFSEENFISTYAKEVNQLVNFETTTLSNQEYIKFARGQAFSTLLEDNYYWIRQNNQIHGLAQVINGLLTVSINYSQIYI